MMPLLLNLGFALLGAAMLLAVFRLVRGPSIYDRILAFDGVVVCASGMVVLLSRQWHTAVYLDLILILSSIGFFSTVAFAFYFERAARPRPGSKRRSRREEMS